MKTYRVVTMATEYRIVMVEAESVKDASEKVSKGSDAGSFDHIEDFLIYSVDEAER